MYLSIELRTARHAWRDETSLPHRPGSDESIDYTEPRFHEALAFGRAACAKRRLGLGFGRDVVDAGVVALSPAQGKWMDVRGRRVHTRGMNKRLSLPSEDDWSDNAINL
jgi:hypothetical protein